MINCLRCGRPLKSDETSLGNVAHRFRVTRWTVVVLSAQSQPPGFQVALGALGAVVRKEIGRTVSEPAEIEDELRALCDALTASEGRLER